MCDQKDMTAIRYYSRAAGQRRAAYQQLTAKAARAQSDQEKKLYSSSARRYAGLYRSALAELKIAMARRST